MTSVASCSIALKQGHSPLTLTKGAVKNQNSFLSNIGLNLGHALASFATYRILSEKLRFSCFSQVPTGSDYPSFRPILPKIYLYFDFLQPLCVTPRFQTYAAGQLDFRLSCFFDIMKKLAPLVRERKYIFDKKQSPGVKSEQIY